MNKIIYLGIIFNFLTSLAMQEKNITKTLLSLKKDTTNLQYQVKNVLKNKMSIEYILNNEGSTELMAAVLNENKDLIIKLISKGSNVNQQSDLGFTALMLASYTSNKEIVQILLNSGAQINHQSYHGWNALFSAIENNDIEMVKILLENGALINQRDFQGWTALMNATLKEEIDIVNLLLKHKDLNLDYLLAKSIENKNVMDYAIESENQEIMDLIELKAKELISKQNKN